MKKRIARRNVTTRCSIRNCGRSLLTAAVGLMLVPLARGQDNTVLPVFDVASIRLSQPGLRGGSIKPLPGGSGYTAQNIPVKLMISLMYKVPMRQIEGGPDWLNTDNYDIEARTDHPSNIDDLHNMFENLLADRFNLKLHKEIKEGPVYALVVDKSGLKMKIDGTGQDLKIPINYGKDNEAIGTRVPMRYLCWWIGQQLRRDDRPVIDETDLKDSYDFTLKFAPEVPPDVPKENLDLPSIFDALRDQLGLRLVAKNGPVESYVIDYIERPSEN
jgi:uncharacterized protein (TIGR03435 family)